jgi:hypothetical protein
MAVVDLAAIRNANLWAEMSVDRYATFCTRTDIPVLHHRGIWWKRVRPFFYRPILPFESYDVETVAGSTPGWFQHAVKEGQPHNSYLNFMVFKDVRTYDLCHLHESARRYFRAAMKSRLLVRRIDNEYEFAGKGYDAYLSFYRRTAYTEDEYRRTREGFARWSRLIFEFPELGVFGAFLGDRMVSFEVSCVVRKTLLLLTRVHSDEGLSLHAPDLMLHAFRCGAREHPGIDRIFDSMVAARGGVNEFKIRRGASVESAAACLHIHPALLSIIARVRPRIHRRLVGLSPEEIHAQHSVPSW